LKKISSLIFTGLIVASLLIVPAMAKPEKTEGFVCPVLTFEKEPNMNTPFIMIGEGHYSVVGPTVNVPIHATNGDGVGTPPGPHSEPGDTDYTAIWAAQ
jgi:hypothetical protein